MNLADTASRSAASRSHGSSARNRSASSRKAIRLSVRKKLESAREAVHHLMEEEFEQLKKAIARERRTGITQQFLSHLIDSTQVLLDFYEIPGGQKARPDRLLKAG